MVPEPRLVAARGFESALGLIAGTVRFACRSRDQRLRGMPPKTVDGERETRFVQIEQFDRSPIRLSDAESGDDLRKCEGRLSSTVRERRFPGKRRFVGRERIADAAKSQKRRGLIDMRLSEIEFDFELEVAIEQLQRDLRMG